MKKILKVILNIIAVITAFSGAQNFVVGMKPHHAKTVSAISLRDRLPHPPGEGMGYYALGRQLKYEGLSFKKLGALVKPDSPRYKKLGFAALQDVLPCTYYGS